MSLLNVTLDASKLAEWAQVLSNSEIKNAVRRAIDQSARYARKAAIKVIAADIGVPAAKFKAATPKVKSSTAAFLAASWTVNKLRIGILNVSGAKVSKSSGLTASTHRLSGGKSQTLNIRKAFVVKTKDGGTFVAYRTGKARLPIKGVYAEHPATAIGQANAPAAKEWDRIASHETQARLGVELQKALDGKPSSSNAVSDD
jgi:hypothetical protein